MRISVQASKAHIESAIDWISGLIGAAIDKRVAAFKQHERKNPLLATYFRENYALEFALADARKYRKTTGRLPQGPEYDQLYGFIIPAHRIHAALPPEVKKPFEGRLRDAVNGLYGARPFAYEVGMATHLMSKGWDIDWADYSGLGRFDFLARQASVEIEVECKTSSGDTGRKIHRQEVNRLADLILPATERLAGVAGCHLIRITIPDRLGKSNPELSEIAATVATAAQQKGSASKDSGLVDYTFDGLSHWPDPAHDLGARDFFFKRFGVTNSHLLFYARPDFSVVAVAITSAKADSVVNALSDQAKEAADQCSGTRPAIVALQLIDQIARPELETMLKTPNGLHAIAHTVFKGGTRLHVDSIAFTVPQLAHADGPGATRLSAPVITLFNDKPQFPCSEIRSIFR
jgi:fructose-specific phosphotransferase system component IIB